jgi:hypothetical protein
VQQPGERLRLGADVGRDLEHDLTVGQNVLLRDEDPSERAAAQLAEQVEPGELVTGGRERDCRVGESEGGFGIVPVQDTKHAGVRATS